MGMYTELVITAQIKNDPAVVEVLKYMLKAQPGTPRPPLPDHPLFKTDRWHFMLQGSSYYFVPRSTYLFEYDDIAESWVLISRSDFKNYDDEVAHFVDWIKPHLDMSGQMFGYSRYEKSKDPTVYYAPENASG